MIIKNILLLVSILLLFSGCAFKTKDYAPDFNSVNKLKDLNAQSMNVGKFSSQNQKVNNITLRGSEMYSPENGSYSEYLKKSLKEHLMSAGLYDNTSKLIVSGELLKNEVNTGMSIGVADISANFVALKNGQLAYEKTHTIHHEWESSFVGAVAIPNAIENYPIAMQKLLNKLFEDEDFIKLIQTK